jgi:DNA-binding transcriptional ArsR family regulator
MLADGLVAAALRRNAEPRRPRLRLVSVNGSDAEAEASLLNRTRCYLQARRLRDSLFPEGVFADPAWDLLLDLFACKLEGMKVCVSSACSSANVPQPTAIRWVERLEQCGLVERRADQDDSGRIYVELTPLATWRIELWLKATFEAEDDA